MMNIHSKYDNIYRNGMFYALICIGMNNCVIKIISCMLSGLIKNLIKSNYHNYVARREEITANEMWAQSPLSIHDKQQLKFDHNPMLFVKPHHLHRIKTNIVPLERNLEFSYL